MGLAQYHLVKWSHGNSLGTSRRTGNPLNMSSVFLEFTFQRRQGFYILQVHTPFKHFTIRKNIIFLSFFYFYREKSLLLVALTRITKFAIGISDLCPIDIDCLLLLGNVLVS